MINLKRLPTIRLTKTFRFEMAHALPGHDGACKNIHGHSYVLDVRLAGKPLFAPGNPKHGMVMDFSDLKVIVKKEILDVFDHALVLPEDHTYQVKNDDPHLNIVLVNYQPTCEMLLLDFKQRIQSHLPENVALHSLRLRETSTSYAEWYADDNL
jgi:6-pyruvoyltetrahydropterin/6-carboxytetrahydropterin synthase